MKIVPQQNQHISHLLQGPVLLRSDNFTPLQRTPWAGQQIARRFKNILHPEYVDQKIGEAWEFSCDAQFPSKLCSHDIDLIKLVQDHPQEVLSPSLISKGQTSCEILLKTLDADDPLSLQVHPQDDDSHLKSHECGKPESWYVISSKEGCGIYLGFKSAIEPPRLTEMLENSPDQLRSLLQFVEVKAGDYFEIMPGVPHAVGPGVLLCEPQRLLAGKSGKTYRMWDWGRKYDAAGALNPVLGTPRDLHIRQSMPLINPMTQYGEAFVDSLRRHSIKKTTANGVAIESFPANSYYQLHRLNFDRGQALEFSITGGYGAALVFEGSFDVSGLNQMHYEARKGQPLLLPHAANPFKLIANSDQSAMVLIIPDSAKLNY